MTILVWSCYPCVWLFSEGFASFSVSFEITMYAILDVINKVVLCFMVMSSQDILAEDEMAGNREYV
jgi:bacteriorhodopsin